MGARHFDQDGQMDFSESEVNLALATRTRDLLLKRGYRVLLTRGGDYLLNRGRRDINGDGQIDHVDESQARVDMINAARADLLLSKAVPFFPELRCFARAEVNWIVSVLVKEFPPAAMAIAVTLFKGLADRIANVIKLKTINVVVHDQGFEVFKKKRTRLFIRHAEIKVALFARGRTLALLIACKPERIALDKR